MPFHHRPGVDLELRVGALEREHAQLKAQIEALVAQHEQALREIARLRLALGVDVEAPTVVRVPGAGQSLSSGHMRAAAAADAPASPPKAKELEVVCAVCGKAVLARATFVIDQGAACVECYSTRAGE